MPLRTLRTPISPSVADVIQSAIAEQDLEHDRHLRAIHTRDADRKSAWWRTRLSQALRADTPDPLRILISASRFTTVLHATCSDLAESLRGLGCTVELITEPSEHRRLSPLAYSRIIDRFDPDIILAPNHTRTDLERVITGSPPPTPERRVLPVGVPFVLWVQDSMPHLLTLEAGAAIGPLDIAMGYISRAMVEQFGYPTEAILPAPLVASEQKFNTSRINPTRAEELACDVAIISHHAETPEHLRDRLLDELSTSPEAQRIARDLIPTLESIARNPMAPVGINTSVRRAVLECAAHLDPSAQEMLIQNVALRLIDRTLRHQSAHWAADICDTNNWTFRIFGTGWEHHPTLGRFAFGPLEHGDDLAAAYNAAGITLHISAFSPLHQRLIECSLSGGVPIIRRTRDALRQSLFLSKLRILRSLEPDNITDPNDGCGPILWFDHLACAETVRYTTLMQRLGMTIKAQIPIRDPATDPRIPALHPMQLDADPHLLMGDLWETSYESRDELESIIHRARAYPNWRTSLSRGVAGRARNLFTHNALARQLLKAIGQRAEASTQPAAP
ncbi:MAG TPA: hypothetical protein ENJ00_09655 [Phycisphaerales bacterium]|nr:hypothetical protein [Phycisphaerales bacterium]